MATKLTSQLIASVHALARDGLSGRAIADRLGCSEATIRRARHRDPSPARRPPQPDRRPILLSHPIQQPSPCPETAPAWVRRLYASLVQRALLSELDALIVFADLDVKRTHLCLDVFSTDVLLQRIAALPESVDLADGIARLRDAFKWDDRLRAWCRDVAQDVDS